MNPKKNAVLAAATAAALLSVSACGGSNSAPGSSGSGGGDANGAVLPNTAWKTAPYDQVKQGGTLVQAVGALPTNYNALTPDGNNVDTTVLETPVANQTGVTFSADGKWEVDPDYVESAKLVSKSPQKIQVKLNPKAVWSDGKPINYTDVVNFWKVFSGKNPKFQIVSDTGWKDVKSIEKGATDYEYTITYAKVNADWPNFIYPALPSSVTTDAKVFNTGYAKKMTPSNGPYVVSNIDGTGGVVTETPNPRWWGRKPKLDKIVFRVVSQASLGQAFANKEIDVADTGANADVLAQAQKRSDAVIEKSGGLSWSHLTFNASKGPLADVHVRRAIAHAIDRDTFVAVTQKQLGVKPVVQGSAVYVPGQAGYQDVAKTEIGYDLKTVASEMKAAGYAKGSDGVYAKGGTPLSLKILVPSDTPTNAQRAQLIQGFLKKVGITVNLDTVPVDKYFDYIIKKNYDMTSFGWAGTPFPVSTSQPIFDPVSSGQNYTGITDPRLGGLWARANAELDPTRQQEIVHRIDKVIFDYVPLVTLSTTPTIWAVKKGLVNTGASQFQTPDYTEVGYAK